MSKYDIDNIFRDLSKINEMTNPVRHFSKSFVNCNERIELSSVSRYSKQLDHFHVKPDPDRDTAPQLINRRGITVNKFDIKSESVQIGDHNIQNNTYTISQLIGKVAESDDEEAKSLLKNLIENNTVASILGAGVTALINSI
ncbi:hypothetical protein [Photobacterium leiognathi]|uniref:hypothetical protein n=1 Tax=Photobacterium leiognathi TaxID=553611 RepID=UPI0027347A7D|nr:hypothetical protein [Photobacterium leiognathi]